MSNSNESQETSVMMRVRVPEKIARDFRIACAINDETGQDALLKAVKAYIRDTRVPDDTAIGKQ